MNAAEAAPGTSDFPRYEYRSPSAPSPGEHAKAESAFIEGVQFQKSGHIADAIKAYQQATRLDPSYYDAHYNLGLALTSAGHLEDALSAYETALAIRTNSLDARYNLALVLIQANYVTDAVGQLEKLLAAFPNDARAHLALANLYAQRLHDPAKAREQYLKVLENDPRNPQAGRIRYWLVANPP